MGKSVFLAQPPSARITAVMHGPPASFITSGKVPDNGGHPLHVQRKQCINIVMCLTTPTHHHSRPMGPPPTGIKTSGNLCLHQEVWQLPWVKAGFPAMHESTILTTESHYIAPQPQRLIAWLELAQPPSRPHILFNNCWQQMHMVMHPQETSPWSPLSWQSCHQWPPTPSTFFYVGMVSLVHK